VDFRDQPTWVALELTPMGEQRVDDGTLREMLRRDLGVGKEHPIFIPAAVYPKQERLITVYLMEGYAFVGSGLPETTYFALEELPYISRVMSTAGPYNIRTLSTVSDDNILELRRKLQELISEDITEGASVEITQGIYRSLHGVVRGVEEDQVFVWLRLRSLEVIATLPRFFLRILDPQEAEGV